MLPETFTLEVITPERAVVHESVVEVSLPGRGGYLGILPGHLGDHNRTANRFYG